MTGGVAAGGYTEMLFDHAEEVLGPTEIEPEPEPEPESGSRAESEPERPARFGTRELDVTGRRALNCADDLPRVRPWARSPIYAVREWATVRDEGAALRSSCDPGRGNDGPRSSSQSRGGRAHHQIEKVRTVSRALDRAEAAVVDINIACPVVLPSQARAIFELRVIGHARMDYVSLHGLKQKGRYLRRDPLTAVEVAEASRLELGLEVTRQHVLDLCSHFLAIVRRDMVASGEMRAVAHSTRRRGFAADPAARIRGR